MTTRRTLQDAPSLTNQEKRSGAADGKGFGRVVSLSLVTAGLFLLLGMSAASCSEEGEAVRAAEGTSTTESPASPRTEVASEATGDTPAPELEASSTSEVTPTSASDPTAAPTQAPDPTPAPAPDPTPAPAPALDFTKQIAGLGGLCLDIPSQQNNDGQNLEMHQCNGTVAQQWFLSGGQIVGMGLCLDIEGPSKLEGARIQIWTCNGADQHQWRTTSNGEIVSEYSGLCLEVAFGDTSLGAPLQQWTCNGTPQQIWQLP